VEYFREARTDVDVDVDASIAMLPKDAAVKGIYFNDVMRRANTAIAPNELFAAASVTQRRYLPFLDYPYPDWMRIAVVATRALSPNVTLAAGLRELGRHAYDAFLGTQVGRVLFGVLNLDASAILRAGPRAYRVVVNFGEISVDVVNDRCFRYRFREFPAFLETYQVGVLEGVLTQCHVSGRVLIAMRDTANADIEISID
jgi:uncharacterized protein (TIGR02265 family)